MTEHQQCQQRTQEGENWLLLYTAAVLLSSTSMGDGEQHTAAVVSPDTCCTAGSCYKIFVYRSSGTHTHKHTLHIHTYNITYTEYCYVPFGCDVCGVSCVVFMVRPCYQAKQTKKTQQARPFSHSVSHKQMTTTIMAAALSCYFISTSWDLLIGDQTELMSCSK